MVKTLQIAMRDGKLHIEDYPHAIALKQIDDSTAGELQEIALHYFDLAFCHEALAQIARLDRAKDTLLIEALWIASVARYFKCFGSSQSRTQLSVAEVLKAHVGADGVFAYFKSLRNKHIIHDENPYSQSFTGIAINSKEAEFKIADVISLAINAFTADDSHYVQFSQLVEVSFAWVTAKREELHNRLGKAYEQWKYDDLMALPEIKYTAPSAKQVGVKR